MMVIDLIRDIACANLLQYVVNQWEWVGVFLHPMDPDFPIDSANYSVDCVHGLVPDFSFL